jgi:hypothetical protein
MPIEGDLDLNIKVYQRVRWPTLGVICFLKNIIFTKS